MSPTFLGGRFRLLSLPALALVAVLLGGADGCGGDPSLTGARQAIGLNDYDRALTNIDAAPRDQPRQRRGAGAQGRRAAPAGDARAGPRRQDGPHHADEHGRDARRRSRPGQRRRRRRPRQRVGALDQPRRGRPPRPRRREGRLDPAVPGGDRAPARLVAGLPLPRPRRATRPATRRAPSMPLRAAARMDPSDVNAPLYLGRVLLDDRRRRDRGPADPPGRHDALPGRHRAADRAAQRVPAHRPRLGGALALRGRPRLGLGRRRAGPPVQLRHGPAPGGPDGRGHRAVRARHRPRPDQLRRDLQPRRGRSRTRPPRSTAAPTRRTTTPRTAACSSSATHCSRSRCRTSRRPARSPPRATTPRAPARRSSRSTPRSAASTTPAASRPAPASRSTRPSGPGLRGPAGFWRGRGRVPAFSFSPRPCPRLPLP